MQNITVLGTGYVGLVSGICLAELGHTVTCIDTDPHVIARLKAGHVPIYEPGLEDMLTRVVATGRLKFDERSAPAVAQANAILIAVGTPGRSDGNADLRAVYAAVEEVAVNAPADAVVVMKSTVPIGTARMVKAMLDRHAPDRPLHIASNPEFLREGTAIGDFMAPDRIVIGTGSEIARETMAAIYTPLAAQGVPVLHTDCASAEMIKYAANALLAMKVTFINEISELCDRLQADVTDVAQGLGLDQRIGPAFLKPGPGIGGSCFPKDTRAFARIGQEHGFPLKIVEAAIDSNDQHKARMTEKLRDILGGSFAGKTVAVLGVTFKPDTDDMRESPALTILPAMIGNGAQVRAVDPQGRKTGEALLPLVAWFDDAYGAAEGADLLVVLTEWKEFGALDLPKLARVMATPRLADLRNMFDPADAVAAGFQAYTAVGRTSRFPADGTVPVDRPKSHSG